MHSVSRDTFCPRGCLGRCVDYTLCHVMQYILARSSSWCHQLETFSSLLAYVRGTHRSPVNCLALGKFRFKHAGKFVLVDINHTGNISFPSYDTIIMYSIFPWIYQGKHMYQCLLLTHWGRDQMDAISQTTLSNVFPWLTFHWSLFLRI